MATATPTQAYATAIEADTFLELHDDWLDLDEPIKDDALLWGRYYIDANFDCVVDYDTISEEVKYATSLLAYDYFIQGDLFFDNNTNLKSKKVDADGVLVEKDFGYVRADKPKSLSKVVAILKTVCNHTKGGLVRV